MNRREIPCLCHHELIFLPSSRQHAIKISRPHKRHSLCKDKQGSRYIVEIQVARTMGFEKRAQYYASKTYCSQAQVADKYPDLKEEDVLLKFKESCRSKRLGQLTFFHVNNLS
ncbi:MAG: hypothetical protein EB127_29375 [Alphaproteobacteria bacterium]|nr:hypothetical protein [Alphaproteobacteria bacterium]